MGAKVPPKLKPIEYLVSCYRDNRIVDQYLAKVIETIPWGLHVIGEDYEFFINGADYEKIGVVRA